MIANWQSTSEGRSLHELYSEHGLTMNSGVNCSDYERCSASCNWDGRKLAPPTGAFVGEAYSKFKILFVGINSNKGGNEDFYDCYNWISKQDSAHSPFIDGAIHRCVQKYFGEPELQPCESRKRFAFTNVIKCSVEDLAGLPTDVMTSNCLYSQSILRKEMAILQPRVVICMGTPPFGALLGYFITSAQRVQVDITQWLATVMCEGEHALVLRLINPGQGYRNSRTVLKQIRNGVFPSESSEWTPLLRDRRKQLNEMEIRQENDPKFHSRMIDPGNSLYELLVETLFTIAKTLHRS